MSHCFGAGMCHEAVHGMAWMSSHVAWEKVSRPPASDCSVLDTA